MIVSVPREPAKGLRGAELRAKAARGGAVTLVAQGLKAAARIGSMMILARLLAPEDFGLQGMVLVVSGFVSLFRDAGLGLATVQRETIRHEETSTLFWINAVLGLMLAATMVALAQPLAAFYGEPRLRAMAMVSSVAFVFSGVAVQHQALLQRELRFSAIAINEVASSVLGTAVGVAMAVAGYGYWALVGMAVTVPAAFTVGLWLAMPWIPGLPRKERDIRSMLHLGGTWTFVSLASYVSYNLEKLLLGRFWGAPSLGLYGRAYQLTSLPNELLSSVGTVVVSTLSRLQHNPDELRRAFVMCYSLVVSVTIPVAFMCLLAAEEIVGIVLGPKWRDAAGILRALAPSTLAFSLMFPWGWLLQATAKNRVGIGTTMLVPPMVIAGILLGLRYGPVGVALGYSTGVSLVAIPVIAWCRSAGEIRLRDIWDAVRRPIWAGLLALACGGVVKSGLPVGVMLPLALAAESIVFLAVYALMLLVVFDRRTYYVGLVRSMANRSGTTSDACA
jgi:PST family polysaccharide transporter